MTSRGPVAGTLATAFAIVAFGVLHAMHGDDPRAMNAIAVVFVLGCTASAFGWSTRVGSCPGATLLGVANVALPLSLLTAEVAHSPTMFMIAVAGFAVVHAALLKPLFTAPPSIALLLCIARRELWPSDSIALQSALIASFGWLVLTIAVATLAQPQGRAVDTTGHAINEG